MPAIDLRPTEAKDIAFVVATEHAQENRRWIIPWSRDRHELSLASPEIRHLIAQRASDGTAVGYVILAGLHDHNGCVEFRRLVIAEKSAGYGRSAVRAVQQLVFEDIGAHRLWLDVKEANDRARRLYTTEGFVTEGVLRDCLKTPDGFESLVLMSMLRREFELRRRAAFHDAPVPGTSP